MRISKTVMAVGGAVVVAAAIGFTNPKAVHAMAAALVQVTNTTANPVVSGEVTLNPAQIVELYCPVAPHDCYQVQPGGLILPTPYSVPAGQTLVVTDIDIHTVNDGDKGAFQIAAIGDCNTCTASTPAIWYEVPDDGATYHFSLTRGVAWSAGEPLYPVGKSDQVGYLYGYLTNN